MGSGIKIAIDSDDYEYSAFGAYRARVRTSKVVVALKDALAWRDDSKRREAARGFVVKHYDYKHVWSEYMKPALVEQIEGRKKIEANRLKRTTQRLLLRQPAGKPDTIEEQSESTKEIVDIDETKQLITSTMVKDSA